MRFSMVDVVELNEHVSMTVEQAFKRIQRESLEKVIIIGRLKTDGHVLVTSNIDNMELYWALQKIAQAVFDG